MNNTDKLLRAFIEASGFEIQEIKEEFYKGEFKGLGTEIHERVIDYKVTKKDDYVPLPVQSKEWGCIVEYLTDHYEDIEIGIDDFGTLKPIMEFISRNSPN